MENSGSITQICGAIIQVATAIITIASIITATTKTPRTNQKTSKIYRFIELLGLNVGRAKEKAY